jgi:hypothetical protein
MWVDLDCRSLWSISSFPILYGAKYITQRRHSDISTAKICIQRLSSFNCMWIMRTQIFQFETQNAYRKATENREIIKSFCARVISLTHHRPTIVSHACMQASKIRWGPRLSFTWKGFRTDKREPPRWQRESGVANGVQPCQQIRENNRFFLSVGRSTCGIDRLRMMGNQIPCTSKARLLKCPPLVS